MIKYILLSLFVTSGFVFADEVSSEQAVFAVNMWRSMGVNSSMRGRLSYPNGEVSTLIVNGAVACHVVALESGGFVITSGNDFDPVAIRGFSDEGAFDPSVDTPLKNLLVAASVSDSGSFSRLSYGVSSNEEATFVKQKVNLSALQCGTSFGASSSWKELLSPSILRANGNGLSTIDDICVPPFVKAKWNQGNFEGTDPSKMLGFGV